MDVGFPQGNVAERWNRAFHVLSKEPRRELLMTLSDKSAAAWVPLPEAALSPHYPGNEEQLKISLHHQHLPALEEQEYVVWNESPFEARQGPNFGEIEAIIRAIMDSKGDLPNRLVTGCRALEKRPDD